MVASPVLLSCALMFIYTVTAQTPSCAFCAELTTGSLSTLPGNTDNIKWTNGPTIPSENGRCNIQGVLKITPPSWAKSVTFLMSFKNSTGFSFNIADSPTNNGYGGDASTTNRDAEIHGLGSKMLVYESDVGATQLRTYSNTVKSAMMIRLSQFSLFATNYVNLRTYEYDNGLFIFDTMYFGLNRVVQSYTGAPSGGRVGTGLCSVCVFFHKESTPTLNGPETTIDQTIKAAPQLFMEKLP